MRVVMVHAVMIVEGRKNVLLIWVLFKQVILPALFCDYILLVETQNICFNCTPAFSLTVHTLIITGEMYENATVLYYIVQYVWYWYLRKYHINNKITLIWAAKECPTYIIGRIIC